MADYEDMHIPMSTRPDGPGAWIITLHLPDGDPVSKRFEAPTVEAAIALAGEEIQGRAAKAYEKVTGTPAAVTVEAFNVETDPGKVN